MKFRIGIRTSKEGVTLASPANHRKDKASRSCHLAELRRLRFLPTSQLFNFQQASSNSGPAASWIAPLTPFLPSKLGFVALTIISTLSLVISPRCAQQSQLVVANPHSTFSNAYSRPPVYHALSTSLLPRIDNVPVRGGFWITTHLISSSPSH